MNSFPEISTGHAEAINDALAGNQNSKREADLRQIQKFFYDSQVAWIQDDSPLKILVKSRQTGFSFANSFRLVTLVSAVDARLDAYIVSRDLTQAKLSLEDCVHWAKILHQGASDLGEILFDHGGASGHGSSAFALQFANGRRIYCLSSNPNALAGKRGHVTLDEFALHPDQRLLYRVAKPVTTWGGQLSIISTHRGANTLFNQIITSIKSAQSSTPAAPDPDAGGRGSGDQSKIKIQNSKFPNGSADKSKIENQKSKFANLWSLHEVPIQRAVDEGIVERINKKTGRNESRPAFLARLRAECIDEDQWLQEYCCIPADESAAFFPYDLIDACTDRTLRLLTLPELLAQYNGSPRPSDGRGIKGEGFGNSQLSTRNSQLFLGLDVARRNHLCVIDVGEKIGNAIYDRVRLEFHNQTFTAIESALYPLLALPQLKRACIDASGMGIQLGERARERFGWKVQPITFTGPLKEELAFALRRDFEDHRLRIVSDDLLRADLHAIKKEFTPSGKITFIGDTEESHCDRTWAKALRQHAARHRPSAGALVV